MNVTCRNLARGSGNRGSVWGVKGEESGVKEKEKKMSSVKEIDGDGWDLMAVLQIGHFNNPVLLRTFRKHV